MEKGVQSTFWQNRPEKKSQVTKVYGKICNLYSQKIEN